MTYVIFSLCKIFVSHEFVILLDNCQFEICIHKFKTVGENVTDVVINLLYFSSITLCCSVIEHYELPNPAIAVGFNYENLNFKS